MTDELRPEYKRSDFGEIVRGKYPDHIKAEPIVVQFEPEDVGHAELTCQDLRAHDRCSQK